MEYKWKMFIIIKQRRWSVFWVARNFELNYWRSQTRVTDQFLLWSWVDIEQNMNNDWQIDRLDLEINFPLIRRFRSIFWGSKNVELDDWLFQTHHTDQFPLIGWLDIDENVNEDWQIDQTDLKFDFLWIRRFGSISWGVEYVKVDHWPSQTHLTDQFPLSGSPDMDDTKWEVGNRSYEIKAKRVASILEGSSLYEGDEVSYD